MKFSVVAGLLASTAVAIDSYTSMDCIDPKDGFHVITAGGEYTTVGNLSLLQTLAQDVLNIKPASQMYQIGYTEGALAPQDITEGLAAFKSHFEEYAAKCPTSKIVTLGYSVGATIIMDTFCGDPRDPQAYGPIDPKYRSNLLANIVYGDLTFVAGQRSAAGNCPDGGHGIVPRTYPGMCYPFGRKTKSYCDVGDPQCCTPGGDPNIHFTYPGIYDQTAADFVQAKWNYWIHNGDDDN